MAHNPFLGGENLALDTLGLRSPFLSEDVATAIENQCILRQGVDLNTGDVIYSITTGSLEGSHDSRISIKVEREIWQASEIVDKQGIKKKSQPIRVPCEPYIYLEASVHKALVGHNVCGGPQGFIESAHWLIGLVGDLLGVQLPDPEIWMVRRIDTAEVFQMPSYEACEEYFRGLNSADYPRRSVTRYGTSGIYAQGSTSTLKFYHKGPEFQKHDRKRLVKILKTEKLFELIDLAHRTIRVEVEIKTRKLENDFGYSPLVREITEEYINRVYDTEVQRFLKEGAKELELVRDAQAVQRRLREVYDDRLAGLLFGTWYQLTTLGEDFVKKSYAKRTFYRQRKQLVDASISWHGTDVILRENHSAVPVGFSPTRSDPRRNVIELPEVRDKLAPIRSKLDFHKLVLSYSSKAQ